MLSSFFALLTKEVTPNKAYFIYLPTFVSCVSIKYQSLLLSTYGSVILYITGPSLQEKKRFKKKGRGKENEHKQKDPAYPKRISITRYHGTACKRSNPLV
jgi:hypothetical protein